MQAQVLLDAGVGELGRAQVFADRGGVELVELGDAVASGALAVPNNPALTGATLSAQAVSLTLKNSANLLTSNGALGTLGL